MTSPKRKQMAFADGDVSYLEWEADAPVLHFAHATGFNAETYRALLAPLAGKFHIFAMDQRGHGFSTLRAEPEALKGWDVYGSDLAGFLAKVAGGKPAVLAGHSMGGIASLMVAARHPELVRAVAVAEPVLVSDTPQTPEQMRAMAERPNLAEMAARRRGVFPSFDEAYGRYRGRGAFTTWPDETLLDYLRGGLVKTGNGGEVRLGCAPAWESATFRNAHPGGARLTGAMKAPLTVLHAEGAIDSTARAGEIDVVRALKPDAKIVPVTGVTHFLPMEKPALVRDAIAAFA
jgi:pimeloyl-ACP methyl ester carboxylesterase